MAPMEDRLRATLRERVADVTTQPALYRHVKARAVRRRRRRLLTAVPAGAAAFGLVLGIPLLLERGPDVPRIDDFAEQLAAQAGPNVPDELVVVRDGEVERLDLATGGIQELGSPVGGSSSVLTTPGASADPLVGVLGGPPTELALVRDSTGLVINDPDVDPSGGVALSPDGRWNALVRPSGDDIELITRANSVVNDAVGTEQALARYLPEGTVIQDWTRGAQPTTTVILYRTPQGTVRTIEVDDASDGVGRLPARNQTDLGGMLPMRALAVASSHLEPDAVLGGPVYSLVPVAGGIELRVTDGGAITAERDVTALLDGEDTSTAWLDAWGDAAVFGDGDRTWIALRDGNGALLPPRPLPDGVTRAAPIAQEIVTPEVAAMPGDPQHALLVLDDGTLVADDLTTGERTELHPPVNRNMNVHSFTVSVGATIEDFVAVGYDDGASDDLGVVTYVRRDGGEVVSSLTRGRELPGGPNNRAPYAVSPDGGWLAYLGGSGEEPVTHVVPIDPRTAALDVDQVHTLDGGPTFVQDWTGPVTDVGDRSRLVGHVGEAGFVEQTLERTADGFVVVGTTELKSGANAAAEDGVQALVAVTSQRPGSGDDPRFELIRRWDRDEGAFDAALLRYVAGEEVLAERIIPFGAYVENLSLAARGGTALIVASAVHGPDEPEVGGRAFVVRVVTRADGGVDILLPTVLDDGPVDGSLLGGLVESHLDDRLSVHEVEASDGLPPPDAVLTEAGWSEAAGWIRRETDAGRPVIVNLFGSWCGPCREAMPLLVDTAREETDVSFLGVSQLDQLTNAQHLIDEHGVDFPTLHDAIGDIGSALGARTMPTTVAFDIDGELVARITGEPSETDIERLLSAVR